MAQKTIDNLKSDYNNLNKENDEIIINLSNQLDEVLSQNKNLNDQKEKNITIT